MLVVDRIRNRLCCLRLVVKALIEAILGLEILGPIHKLSCCKGISIILAWEISMMVRYLGIVQIRNSLSYKNSIIPVSTLLLVIWIGLRTKAMELIVLEAPFWSTRHTLSRAIWVINHTFTFFLAISELSYVSSSDGLCELTSSDVRSSCRHSNHLYKWFHP